MRERAMCCPECGQELGWQDDVFLLGLGDTVAGCSRCVSRQNAVEWLLGLDVARSYWEI